MMVLSNTEIDELEKEMGLYFPLLYRKLLSETGYGEFEDIEIYHPMLIRERYAGHFDHDADLFGTYFPFGCNNRKQEIWLIRQQDSLVASIWHETHSDDYDGDEWLDGGQWLVRHEGQLSAG